MLNLIRRFTVPSTMKLDPAILKLLNLDTASTTVSSAGGGGCSSALTSKIVSKLQDGTEKAFFMKTGSGQDAKVMFEGMSLRETSA
jgi:protein-ribulosamine 3-kinase